MKFIITVDTEADNQWKRGGPITLKNIESLPRFQALCQKYNFIPTYLVTYEVADDPVAVALLSEWQVQGKAEIGAHLHPWTTPPIFPYEKGQHMYPSSLVQSDFKSKLVVLTDKIETTFGNRPTSYRAGRWGFSENHAEILKRLGYTVDCSVTPKINWAQIPDKLSLLPGPDFTDFPINPYYINGLLEVPMTILYTGVFKKEGSSIVQKFNKVSSSLITRILNKLFFQKKWLRIFPKSIKDDWVKIYASAQANNLPVLEFMIHSSELSVGGSPYGQSQKEIDAIFDKLEGMFEFFAGMGLVGMSLRDFSKTYDAKTD